MRKLLPFGGNYSTSEIWAAAQQVYADYPAILNAIRIALGI